MVNKRQKEIIKTLAWFDIFDHPLTETELKRWLWRDIDLNHDSGTESNNYSFKDGYYFLPGRESIIYERERKVPIIEKKLKIARRAAQKMRWVPFVRAIFISNTVAAGSANQKSDIDVFIVVKSGRLFLSRLLITLLLTFFRLRRNKKRVKDRVCLCFYATDDNLNLSGIKINEPDVYLCYWIDQLLPIYDPINIRREIMRENSWVKQYLPNAMNDFTLLSKYRIKDCRIQKLLKQTIENMWGEKYGNFLEEQARGAQEAKMKLNFMSVQNEENTNVIINNKMLKFHENDRRGYYRDEWKKRCAERK